MALNDPSHLSIPAEDDETPRSPDAIRAIALVGLPELTGAESEISVAASIRERLLIEADDYMTALRGDAILTAEQADTAIEVTRRISGADVQAAQAALNRLRHETESAWWVTKQEATIEEVMREE